MKRGAGRAGSILCGRERASWEDGRRFETERAQGAASCKHERERKDGEETKNQERERDIQETERDGRASIRDNKKYNGVSAIYAARDRESEY